MRRLVWAALALATCCMVVPTAAEAQTVRGQRRAEIRERVAQRSAEARIRAQQRRAEILQRLQERHPQLTQRLAQRRAEGKRLGVLVRKMLLQRRLKLHRPELFQRLDLNHDGRLQLREFRQRPRGRIHRT